MSPLSFLFLLTGCLTYNTWITARAVPGCIWQKKRLLRSKAPRRFSCFPHTVFFFSAHLTLHHAVSYHDTPAECAIPTG
ncbi:hypothetical protein HOY82DRAFT_129939 [Tuber indicum]|nr:hypothetical protein HOY82DRAFT_129939 [Tuber indicum]